MILTGRDERESLPFIQNYNKYLDIYLSTSRLAHRAFTVQEQRGIAMKDIITFPETMGVPKVIISCLTVVKISLRVIIKIYFYKYILGTRIRL